MVTSVFSGCAKQALSSSDVPSRYQHIYSLIDEKLGDAENFLDKKWDGEIHGTKLALEFLGASSNKGELLLTEKNWQANMLWLDIYEKLGLDALSLCISYPILTEDFKRCDEYLDYYVSLMTEMRMRGFQVNVESTTIFPDGEFSNAHVDYSDLTIARYKREKTDMLQLIIDYLKPDMLTVENEPSTRELNTGLDFNRENYVDIVKHFITSIEPGTTKIGAGIGTWDDVRILEDLAGIEALDYLDIHIYPVNFDCLLPKIKRTTEIAKEYGKDIATAECWLMKYSDDELGVVDPGAVYARDAYSFWEPLDIRFVSVMTGLANHYDFLSLSFFWNQYLFAYLEYEGDKTYTENLNEIIPRITRNAISNPVVLTGTGKILQSFTLREE